MRKTTFRETDLQERYIDEWMKRQTKRTVAGKLKDIKRSDFFHHAIAQQGKYELQDHMAQVFDAEFKRLHGLIEQQRQEMEHLRFRLKALGDPSP